MKIQNISQQYRVNFSGNYKESISKLFSRRNAAELASNSSFLKKIAKALPDSDTINLAVTPDVLTLKYKTIEQQTKQNKAKIKTLSTRTVEQILPKSLDVKEDIDIGDLLLKLLGDDKYDKALKTIMK